MSSHPQDTSTPLDESGHSAGFGEVPPPVGVGGAAPRKADVAQGKHLSPSPDNLLTYLVGCSSRVDDYGIIAVPAGYISTMIAALQSGPALQPTALSKAVLEIATVYREALDPEEADILSLAARELNRIELLEAGRDALVERLGPISPQGDDKIDELETALGFVRDDVARLHAEKMERIEARIATEAARAMRDRHAYRLGFEASAQGWNGEHTFGGEPVEADATWVAKRDEQLQELDRGQA